MAALYFEKAESDFEKGKNGAGLVRLAACWRAAVAADDTGWKHTALGAISAWARYTPSPQMVINCGHPVERVAFSPDGRNILVGNYTDGGDGNYAAGPNTRSPGGVRTVRLWDAATGAARGPLMEFKEAENERVVLAFSPDAGTVLVCTCKNEGNQSEGRFQLWDAATGRPRTPSTDLGDEVNTAVFSPDGRLGLLVTSFKLCLLNLTTRESLVLQTGHTDGEKYSPPWTWAMSRLRLTAAETLAQHGLEERWEEGISPSIGWFQSGCFGADGRSVLIGGAGGALLLDAETGSLLTPPFLESEVSRHKVMPANGVIAVGLSRDGRIALTRSPDGQLRHWDAATGKLITIPLRDPTFPDRDHHGRRPLCSSSDGCTILTGSHLLRTSGEVDGSERSGAERCARLWDAASGLPLGEPVQHLNEHVSARPDGLPVVGPVQHPNEIVAFSPDGKTAVTAGRDGDVRLWDTATGQPIGLSMATRNPVTAIAFSPDGRYFSPGLRARRTTVGSRLGPVGGAATAPPNGNLGRDLQPGWADDTDRKRRPDGAAVGLGDRAAHRAASKFPTARDPREL